MGLTIDPRGLETRIIHDLIDFGNKEVLEIGCGDGRLTWRYVADAARVTAIDPDAAVVGAANDALLEEMRSRVSFGIGDISALDLPEADYDVALFSGSL